MASDDQKKRHLHEKVDADLVFTLDEAGVPQICTSIRMQGQPKEFSASREPSATQIGMPCGGNRAGRAPGFSIG